MHKSKNTRLSRRGFAQLRKSRVASIKPPYLFPCSDAINKTFGSAMEEQNKRLFEENCQIVRANEILRRKAEQLRKENQALSAAIRRRDANISESSELQPQTGPSNEPPISQQRN